MMKRLEPTYIFYPVTIIVFIFLEKNINEIINEIIYFLLLILPTSIM